jgi:hypothetical protein
MKNATIFQWLLVAVCSLIVIGLVAPFLPATISQTYNYLCNVYWILEAPIPPEFIESNYILNTREYQITLNPKEWTKPNETLILWLEQMNAHNKLLSLRFEDAKERIFTQLGYTTEGSSKCNGVKGLSFRVRHFLTGEEVGNTTVAIKHSGHERQVCPLAMWPAEEFLNRTVQKCEEDIHPCFSKYSRGTSVKLRGIFNPESCEDATRLFPWAYPEGSYDFGAKPHPKTNYTIWESRVSGMLNDTKFLITFELKYKVKWPVVLKHLPKGQKMAANTGEWSIKVFKRWDPVAGTYSWNQEVLKAVNDMFFHLILIYDKYSDQVHKECARTYFSTGKKAFR